MRIQTAGAMTLLLLAPGAAVAGPQWNSPDWTGVYFGVSAGADRNNVDWDSDSGTGLSQFAHLGDTNFNAGLFAGYNYRFASRGVAGLELGSDFLTSNAFEGSGAAPVPTDRVVFTAGGRIGTLVTPMTLLYGRLSYAGIRASAPAERWAGSADEAWLNGYQAAVGVESEVSPSFRLRAEVAFTQAVDSLHLEVPLNDFKPEFLGIRVGAIYALGKPRAEGPTTRRIRPMLAVGLASTSAPMAAPPPAAPCSAVSTPGSQGPFSDIEANWGGWAGYDFQVSQRWVVGAEADYTSLGLANRRDRGYG